MACQSFFTVTEHIVPKILFIRAGSRPREIQLQSRVSSQSYIQETEGWGKWRRRTHREEEEALCVTAKDLNLEKKILHSLRYNFVFKKSFTV